MGGVLNAVDADEPHSFRRRSKEIFVVGVAELPDSPGDMLRAGYPLLVRSLSNVFVPIARNGGGPEAYLITMEQGFHQIAGEADDATFFARVVDHAAHELDRPASLQGLVVGARGEE